MDQKLTRLGSLLLIVLLTGWFGLAQAAGGSLPSRWDYVKEWLQLHLTVWNSNSRLQLLNQLTTERANNVATAAEQHQTAKIDELLLRYQLLNQQVATNLQKKPSAEVVKQTIQNQVEQQATISTVRQDTADTTMKADIAQVQSDAVNAVRSSLQNSDQQSAQDLVDQTVAAWRDPSTTIKDEAATRVYAAGTSDTGNNGVVIDQGEGKVTQGDDGNISITYAPGTGPDSVTNDQGQKVWKIQLGDGQVVDSYTVATKVVIGQSSGTAGNVVVNTINGTAVGGTVTQVVTGGGGGNGAATPTVNTTNGQATGSVQKVVIGSQTAPVSQAGQAAQVKIESGSPASNPGETPINNLNGSNSINQINQINTTGDGNSTSNSGQIQPMAPAVPQVSQ